MASILLIDDDTHLSALLAEYLRGQGHLVYVCADGQKGLQAFFDQKPDLVILDVSMPVKDGWETLKRIRELSQAPVIMLTAHSDESDILRGFSLGADDYVSKPFSFAQMSARVRAVLARSGSAQVANDLLESGDLKVDLSTRHVTRAGALIPLTPTDFI